ncbi:MAG: GAF domain-containing protein [Rhodobacter sp.]|nr:GAF domain-containing protein [Rhodobacter sp.]
MTQSALAQARTIQDRSYSLTELGLLDAPAEAGFDAITRLALRLFDVPVALISVIDEPNDRQFFKSQIGLRDPWAGMSQTPLSHSFCQHVKASGTPLVVPYAPENALVCGNPAIRDLGVIGYMGVPILAPDGQPIGALCVIDGQRRSWTDENVGLLADLANCVSDEIALRNTVKRNAALFAQLEAAHHRICRYTALRESIVMAFMAPELSVDDRFQAMLRAACTALDLTHGAIVRIAGSRADAVFAVPPFDDRAGGECFGTGQTLCAAVAGGEAIRHSHDLTRSELAGRASVFGHVPCTFIGAPIVMNGALYGVLELSSRVPRAAPWGEEELSAISIVAMFASAHLALHGEIAALKRSETALAGHLLDAKRQTGMDLFTMAIKDS